MRWIVGIDLRGRSSGAEHMAAWLHEHAGGGAELVAVHVVEEPDAGDAEALGERTIAGRRELERVMAEHAVSRVFAEARLLRAPTAGAGLCEVAKAEGTDGLVIGRAAWGDRFHLVRLGSVARRILRHLPVPVLVVPPALETKAIGAGAIVMASDLGPTSRAAGDSAIRFAKDLGREVVVAHVDPFRDFGRDFTGASTLFAAWTPRRTVEDIARWCREEGFDARTRLSTQGVVEGLLAIADEEDAPLVVCGSRRLGTVDRLFSSSTSSDLARHAERPVLVVPPMEKEPLLQ